MALAAALARVATRFLRGGLQPFAPAAAVPELSYGITRQFCDIPAAKEPSLSGEDESGTEAEAEILDDVEPVVDRVKGIIHSRRYRNGAVLSPDDEKFVVEKLLSYHPRSEDKIGCGVDSIMVDRHPDHKSRCLFIVRTNGDLEDFSYRKCLRAYIQGKYPSHADRFLEKHVFHRRPQKIPVIPARGASAMVHDSCDIGS
ncbi:hypothetical protein EJB05_44333 [Eragrostis curvula]|uniref:DCL protein n=1 Tax=Eragrostis curvula TaxID=38414 RepID=A0A5J9THJ5_9POAL|nr:hypothetical protein EJB05_44333 [Eragrostis curvula]